MARQTRNSLANASAAELPVAPTPSPPRQKGGKKRKRQSAAGLEDGPATKQSRLDDGNLNDGPTSSELGEPHEDQKSPVEPLAELPIVAELPLRDNDAQKILDILETTDTQGLLDRVFPLQEKLSEAPTSDVRATTPSPSSFISLRDLLKNPSDHPLHLLRTAVQHLLPISSHPRSKPSSTAEQQLRFCKLALDLLDQASHNSVTIPLDATTLFPASTIGDDSTESKSPLLSPPGPDTRPRYKPRYALVQRFPNGEWWTSLNSSQVQPSTDGRILPDLPTGNASLVSILPSSLADQTTLPVPILGSYTAKRLNRPVPTLPGPRRVSCGAFLDYGPYSSFAPTFEQDGRDIGREQLGEVLWRRQRRREMAELRLRLLQEEESRKEIGRIEVDGDVSEVTMTERKSTAGDVSSEDLDFVLEELFSLEQATSIRAALQEVGVEDAVQELLERNGRAFLRLQELQNERLGSAGGGVSEVDPNSEEQLIAENIESSLALLLSLRPRSSDSEEDRNPLMPSASVLRKLHKTLPAAPTQGWYGTLSHPRTLALKDDATLKVKPILSQHQSQSQPGASTTPVPAASTTPQPYQGYPPYANYQQGQAYRPPQNTAAGQLYKAPPVGTYFAPGYYPQQQQWASNQAQPQATGYAYQTGTAAWYAPQASARGTPQPQGHYTAAAQAPVGRAVANTVAPANKGYGQNATGYVAPLPARTT